ncbi:pseudouridine synthase [Candidatus Kryptobacter tengchongensis]|uniref:pseudouridine synthase n=1 Tax=Kryptobacter tengchongensis TaxID=1643429 RepID=UPI0007084325|nr:pseudouridine synthase [Candidatus Kryptobacter tengchongensis]CUS82013.1 ribosomal large subunit pseudouridine synthase B [Candidatus Kryptobacter tengchongensis]
MKEKKMKKIEKADELIRLNKYLAMCGIASRRKADELIQQGRVAVNGEVITQLGIKIDPRKDKVTVDGKPVKPEEKLVYIVLNKPKDCITTVKDEKGRRTVLDLVKVKQRIFPVGRLDRNTTGVLLLTNDGELAYRLMHPKYKIEKAYKVEIDKPIKPEDIEKLKRGIMLDGRKTEACDIYILPDSDRKELGITIHEGRYRQIRRMFERLGYKVRKLHRVSFGGITVSGMKRGEWRYLTEKEIRKLKKLVGLE